MTEIEKTIDYCKFRINYFKAKRKPLPYDKFDQKFCDRCTTKIYRYNLIIEALKEKAERENPKPLTIEELKKEFKDNYNGWLWCKFLSHDGLWENSLSYDDGWRRIRALTKWANTITYSKKWLAYKYEPKEE
jgi:hypothetical protein